ncbi:DUF6286 domain-containing protein [Nocardia mexicana]|uniref:DUF6286 domain-containing protein n=1 Tax=Nocardia mexicana TaxID=279262 RepID=A0A370GHL8_9NOCA|nr:DUF6286 domain-containing protein [Nocardia mexicana]RDI43295.1 hypothetical protein DFR68_12257 [Nocardia mexicana]
MRRRPSRAVPAATVALALLAVCAIVVLSLVQRLTGAKEFVSYDSIVNRLRDIAWEGPWVAVAGVGAVLAGLLLLALAVLPGRPVVVPLAADDEITAGVLRRGLHGALREAAQSVEGVQSARVRLHRRTVRITARTRHAHPADLPEAVCAAVDERVARIGPHPAPRVSTRLRRAGSLR